MKDLLGKMEREINALLASNTSSKGLGRRIESIHRKYGIEPNKIAIFKKVQEYKRTTGN